MNARERPPMQLAGHKQVHVVRGFDRQNPQRQYVIFLCGQRTSWGVLGIYDSFQRIESQGPVTCRVCLRMLAGRKPFEKVGPA